MKSSYIAIILVAIIAVAGVGAYFLLNNSGDSIRTDLKVGDYIEVEISSHGKNTEVNDDYEVASFLANFLYVTTEGFEKTGTETIEYKGQNVVCDVYKQTSAEFGEFAMYIEPISGVKYKETFDKTIMGTGSVELLDTNLDLTKTLDEQVVTNGSFTKTKSTLGSNFETTITVSNLDGDLCTITIVQDENMDMTEKIVIKSIDGEKIKTESGMEFTKTQFLSFVSYEYEKKVLEKEHKVAYGEKYSETIDTAFGKKKVTVQEGTYQDHGFDKVTMTFYFDSNNVLYKTTQGDTQEMTLKGTSLIKL
ncbi:MAG: hypothetical protein IKP04_07980 [Candidatus Methanomethylophilaceae archaeon]|nr:hypothetical protein [Candidatus Methanomethylophilaceae archaeon]